MVSWSIGAQGKHDVVSRIVQDTRPYPDFYNKPCEQLDDVKQLIEKQINWMRRNNTDGGDIYVKVDAKGMCTDRGGLLLTLRVEKLEMDK